MKLKKIMAIALASLTAVMCFASCTAEKEVKTDDDVKKVEDNVNANDKEQKDDDNGEKGTLVMATNAYFKPYEYFDGDKIVGIDVEIANAIAQKLSMNLEIKDMEFATILTEVDTGKADFGMAGMTITEERLESVDFSSSYANGVQSVIVAEGSSITKVEDLFADGAEYKAGVQLGTTGDLYACEDLGEDRVIQYTTANEATLALQSGNVDCVIIDNQPAKALVAENAGLKLLDTAYADEDYAICVKKGNRELLDAINGAIDELTADGTIDEIVAKYIK